ncbi:MAG TPA: AMP-binding protein, partial [Actinomycetota bacterium]|nr:AMP-binding protein [Actinomycetota bacterium]
MPETIPQLFEAAVARAPSQQWLHFEDKTVTLEQAQLEVAGAADVLAGYGVTRGASVLATARNSPAYLFAWLAVTQLGAAIAAVNPESTGAELRGLLGQVRPAVVISDMGLRERVQEAIAEVAPGTPHVLAEELSAASSPPLPASPARPDDVAVMIPTSGTTGRPKLVMQTHRAHTMAGQGFPFWLGLTERDRLMTSLPLFHVNAPAYSVLGSLVAGAGLVLLPRFSAKAFIDQARRYGATEFNAIGAMLEILMRQPERAADADNPLRLCYTGPSPPKDRQLAIERRFGFEIVCGYALSESPYGLVWRRGTRPYGTLGSARQHPELGEVNEARVIGDNGHEASRGEVG